MHMHKYTLKVCNLQPMMCLMYTHSVRMKNISNQLYLYIYVLQLVNADFLVNGASALYKVWLTGFAVHL